MVQTTDQNIAVDLRRHSSAVRMQNLTKIFRTPDGKGETTAVNHIELNIPDGRLMTLLGPSGCGKTTTLRMISGFETPTAGSIFIGDEDVANMPSNKRDISMVFQSYALFPHLSVWDNVAYGLKVKKLGRDEIVRRTNAVMELMQLTGMENRYPNQMSGGQQQRVALARAVVIEPRVLLFDEPLSNLDAKLREHMRDELRGIQKRLGITSLYVTHDQSEAMAISDIVVIMKDGDIMQAGSPQEIYEYPANQFVANFIGKANFIPCTFKGMQQEKATVRYGDHRYVIPNPGDIRNIQPEASCVMAVRPESVRLSASEGSLSGSVTRAVYYGAKIEYEVTLPDSTALIVEVYNPQLTRRFAEGDTVKVSFDDPCVRLLP
ncbi:ABC transporter ATP-binding protein [Ruminococcus sp. OA3]|uniref:ABC transporter ATP-binding protein n=1 Tax=Ruminococcus sp. OA3 TaxID=2914164 RepID=UPI001F05D99E|nr:ABC transporter ATP-binding protein [Ruminococcus sp. OA3]MCH1982217.1 ABC transporter ATP-binding protein [Ruminococcus sp. OA3]